MCWPFYMPSIFSFISYIPSVFVFFFLEVKLPLIMPLVIRPLKHGTSKDDDDDNENNNYRFLHVYHVSGTMLIALNGFSLLILTKNLSCTIIFSILQIGKLNLWLRNMLKGTQLDCTHHCLIPVLILLTIPLLPIQL